MLGSRFFMGCFVGVGVEVVTVVGWVGGGSSVAKVGEVVGLLIKKISLP